jgi:hypothetical protein
MLSDVVLDTNVLMHADNPSEERQGDAIAFLEALLACATAICVDEGFDMEESRNRSLIGGEYLARLTAPSLGYQVLVQVFSQGRVVEVSTAVEDRVRRVVRRCVNKPRDRTFVRVAYNSSDRLLCSHDYDDFPPLARGELSKKLGITVGDAGQVTGLL